MSNIGDPEESLATLGLAFLSKPHGNAPLCLTFPHLGRRQAEGWRGFEVEDESVKGMVMNNNSNISPNNPGVDVGGGRPQGEGGQEGKREKTTLGHAPDRTGKGPFQWPPLPHGGAAGEDSKRDLDRGTEPRATTLINPGPAGWAFPATH